MTPHNLKKKIPRNNEDTVYKFDHDRKNSNDIIFITVIDRYSFKCQCNISGSICSCVNQCSHSTNAKKNTVHFYFGNNFLQFPSLTVSFFH